MTMSDRLLLGPGPSNPYPDATAALNRPLLGHLDPEFLALLDETMARLRFVFRTDHALTFPVSGTGSAGMEACFVNLLEPGRVDTIVGGAVVLVTTMRAFDIDELLVSEDDILDGLARSLA